MSRFGFGFGFGSQLIEFPAIFTPTRNFTTLVTAAGPDRFVLDSAQTSSGDFTHVLKFQFDNLLAQMTLLGGGTVSVNESFLRLDPTDGSVDMLVNGGGFLAGSASAFTPDLKLHILTLSRVGDNYDILLDGSSIQTFNQTAANFDVEFLGVRSDAASQAFDGIIADVDLNADQRFYKIGETFLGSSVLNDTGTDGVDGTATSITSADSEPFTFDGSVSPNTWTNAGATRVIEVAGT